MSLQPDPRLLFRNHKFLLHAKRWGVPGRFTAPPCVCLSEGSHLKCQHLGSISCLVASSFGMSLSRTSMALSTPFHSRNLWIHGLKGGMSRQCRKTGGGARTQVVLCPAWPWVCHIFELLFRSSDLVQTTHKASSTEPRAPKHHSARPLAAMGQDDFPGTAFMSDNFLCITRSEMFRKARLSTIRIFISLSLLPWRCWELRLLCS